MENMRQVVEKRLQQKLSKGMVNVQSATNRLIQEGKISRDFIFDVGTERKGMEPNIWFADNSAKVGAMFKFPKTGVEDFNIHPHALKQLADKLKIPSAYLTTLLFGADWQKDLGYSIMNTHNGWIDRDQMLVRAVGSEVRAFLSDQYRILDTEMIFGTHMDEVFKNGGQLSDAYMNDTKIMVESFIPEPIEIITPFNGSIFMAFGIRVDSSDYGAGALSARSLMMQGVCLNGLVTESVMREIHLGKKIHDNIGLSKETIELDSKLMASMMRDKTKYLYSTPVIKDKMLQIEASANEKVDASNVLQHLKESGKLLKCDCERIGEILMKNDPMSGVQGESTLWKMSQGITAYANDKDAVDEVRRMELQEIAGGLFKNINSN